jgi:hypothetical protein
MSALSSGFLGVPFKKYVVDVIICHSSAAVGATTLVLGAWVANNDMNSGLCRAAMVQFIFWKVYLSSADKQEGVRGGSPQVSLDFYWDWLSCCYGYEPKCRTSCSQNWVFPIPCRERTGLFSNYPFGLLQSLLGLLHKNYSDSAPFQEALGILGVSHIYCSCEPRHFLPHLL